MFGYINPLMSELNDEDINTIKSYYCGLCISIKNKFGNLPRFALNFDSTFFAIFFNGISLSAPIFSEYTCLRHPLTKQKIINTNIVLDYCADLNIMLVYYKFLDDVYDEGNLKNIALLKAFSPYLTKTTHKNTLENFSKNISILNTYEKSPPSKNIDIICHPFSMLMGKIFSDVPFEIIEETEANRNNLYDFGYSLGKWIYLMDALDDLKKDMKRKKFNPLNCVYNDYNLPYEKLILNIKESVDFILMTLASNCLDNFKKIPIIRNNKIINNIVSHGLVDNYMNIFNKL